MGGSSAVSAEAMIWHEDSGAGVDIEAAIGGSDYVDSSASPAFAGGRSSHNPSISRSAETG